MRSLTIKIITLFTILIGATAHANDLKLDHPSLGYWNFGDTQSLVFIESTGKIDWVQNNQVIRSEQYKIQDATCQPSSADSMSGLGLVLSWPFLVGTGRVCLIDSNNKTIHLISQIKNPENSYSVMFLNEDQDFSYFVVLGRPFDSLGYMKLWTIDKKKLSAQQKDFFVNIPDYSGGLWRDTNNLFITLSVYDPVEPQNNLYKLDIKTLTSLIPSAGALDFQANFVKAQGPFPGFTFSIIADDNWFLYFNEGYESFFFNKTSGEIVNTTVDTGCKTVGVESKNWVLLCDGQTIKNLNTNLP